MYDILGVSSTDSCTTIKKAYLKLARTHHPDKGGDPEKFKEILRASEVLTDEKRRRLYDEMPGAVTGGMQKLVPGAKDEQLERAKEVLKGARILHKG